MTTGTRDVVYRLIVLDDGAVSSGVARAWGGRCDEAIRVFRDAVGRGSALRISEMEDDWITGVEAAQNR